jgi:hypothetical protein
MSDSANIMGFSIDAEATALSPKAGNGTGDWLAAAESLGRQFSAIEKKLLKVCMSQEPPLPYEQVLEPLANGGCARLYEIPEHEKEELLRKLYPFKWTPTLYHGTAYDIHERKLFQVKDFKVLREDGYNFLVSPYYADSGGTVLDWVSPGMAGG